MIAADEVRHAQECTKKGHTGRDMLGGKGGGGAFGGGRGGLVQVMLKRAIGERSTGQPG